MKRIFNSLMLTVAVGVAASAQVRPPAPSPGAMFKQTVGITDITLDYSRPSMKGREVFGKLIPYGKVWRTGANQSTKIEFSTDASFGGQKVPAGKYAIMPCANNRRISGTSDSRASRTAMPSCLSRVQRTARR